MPWKGIRFRCRLALGRFFEAPAFSLVAERRSFPPGRPRGEFFRFREDPMSERHEPKHRMDEDLYRLRHSLSHVLAQAVLQVRPKAQLGFGPPVRTGFYYDFLLEEPLSEDDLPDLEKRMRRILQEGQDFIREDLEGEAALERLRSLGQDLKAEYARELLQQYPSLSFYRNGPFTDMCEGPHVASTKEIPPGCFRLDSVAGSYWRGDVRRPMLTRIYGVCFRTEKELEDFLRSREEAQKRDHRRLGQELEIFTVREEVGKGLPLWLPNGTVIREELERFAREVEFREGYQRVATPHIAKAGLYRTSGHLPLYKDSMFPPLQPEDEEEFYLRPMNCPHHHMVYRARPRSYRELPLRLAEYGTVYRFEKSGQLAGLLRVRGLTMNDAHIYCTLDQVKEEFKRVAALHQMYYEKFRLDNVWVRLSLHDREKGKFVEGEELWAKTEAVLREVLEELDVDYEVGLGEAAFYGPKVDYQTANVVGREETASTIQLDFTSAERFGLEYVTPQGGRERPLILHRAPLGTHERFIAFLIERWGGAFPTWLAPVQVRMVPVAPAFVEAAGSLARDLRESLVRAEVDDSHDSFSKKVRNAATAKIPNVWILGGKEVENGTVTWRRYAVEKQATVPVAKAREALAALIRDRIMDNFRDVELPL